ncbi:MAG TPA: SRPBCC family protein [Candidatus Nitrosotalea sp.]|nr:SRPBCC family protein [Candidatus Nitrosotalea sp.]
MNSITETCVVNVPRDSVFEFLSNIENIPKWATKFVSKLMLVDNKYKAQTPIGDVFIRLDVDKKAGLIDIYAGPTENNMTPAYMRIISLQDDASTAVMFTFFQYDSTPDAIWEIFCEWIKIEVDNIRRHFS